MAGDGKAEDRTGTVRTTTFLLLEPWPGLQICLLMWVAYWTRVKGSISLPHTDADMAHIMWLFVK